MHLEEEIENRLLDQEKFFSWTFGDCCVKLHDVVVLCNHMVASGAKKEPGSCISQR